MPLTYPLALRIVQGQKCISAGGLSNTQTNVGKGGDVEILSEGLAECRIISLLAAYDRQGDVVRSSRANHNA
jgi:hypothetical protein